MANLEERPRNEINERTSITIADIRIDVIDFENTVSYITEHAKDGARPAYVVTPNAHHIGLLQNDSVFREAYRHAFLVVPDGVPLLWAAKLLGTPLPGRVNGTDLLEALCARAAQSKLRVHFLGGRPAAARAAADSLAKRYPGLDVVGISCPPIGFEDNPVENERLYTTLRETRPQLLFVGLGAPKQELWMYRNVEHLRIPISVGIGGSFEMLAGMVPRAPKWMQRAGLEWLHRLITEPRRLWKRYVFGNTRFCALIASQYLRAKTTPLQVRTRPRVNPLAPKATITSACELGSEGLSCESHDS